MDWIEPLKLLSEVEEMEINREILKNQRVILLALSKLLTPKCRGSMLDTNGETICNLELIERCKVTEKLLEGKR